VEFSSQGSFLFHASNVRNRRVENGVKLAHDVVQAWKNGKWKNKNWYIVESVHQADCATVIVSEDVSAGVTFNAKGTLTGIPLADAQVALSVSQSRGRMTQVIAGRNLRPLYSCLRVRDGWFSEPSVEPVRCETVNPENSLFVRPGITELLDS